MLHDCTAEMRPGTSAWRTQCAYISRINANGRPVSQDGPATVNDGVRAAYRGRACPSGEAADHTGEVTFNYVLRSRDPAAKWALAADEFPCPPP